LCKLIHGNASTGVTSYCLIEYLSEIRIKHAKILLRKVDLKVYEIAVKVGYNNTKYFSDIFKKITGLTPIEYRKN